MDIGATETEFRLDRLEPGTHEIWVAVDAPTDGSDDETADSNPPEDVDNDRARAFYEKLGFEPYREQLRLDAENL